MLILNDAPAARDVPLAGTRDKPTASIRVRPALRFEVDRARSEAGRLLAALIAAEDAAARAAAVLGEDFSAADFADPDWKDAAAEGLSLLALAKLCVDGWTGIAEADGTPVEFDAANLARLLRDPLIASVVRNAIEARVHVERAEKNASPPLPNGEGGAAAASAPTAA